MRSNYSIEKQYKIETREVSSEFLSEIVEVQTKEDNAPWDKEDKIFRKDDDAHIAFKSVDRDAEDKKVKKYKETESNSVLDELYILREPTLRVWAKKHAYLADSEEDMFSELNTVWLKCINQYNYEPTNRTVRTRKGGFVLDQAGKIKTVFKRTPFNTFLYTSFRNHIANILKKRFSQKRVDEKGVPLESTMMSLDYGYGEESDGDTLYNIIPDTKCPTSTSDAERIIAEIAKGDKNIKKALQDFIEDAHIKRLSTACKLCKGVLPLSFKNRKILQAGGKAGHKLLCKMIEFSGKFNKDFRITSYTVMKDRVIYEIYGHDTRLLRKVNKALKHYKVICRKPTCFSRGSMSESQGKNI